MDKKTNSKLHELNDFDQLAQQDEREDEFGEQIANSFSKTKNKQKRTSNTNFRWLECLLIFLLLALVLYLFHQETSHLADLQNQIRDNPNLPQDMSAALTRKTKPLDQTPLDTRPFYEWRKSEFTITPQLWTYQYQNPNQLQKLILANNKRFAQSSGFTVNVLNEQNFGDYMTPAGNKQLKHTLQVLTERSQVPAQLRQGIELLNNITSHMAAIKKRLILLSVLYQNGGIVIDDMLTITENFDWIRNIKSNPYVNKGNPRTEPKVVGFYSPYYSSVPQKHQKKLESGMEEVDKYMVLIPTLESYFIAAEKQAEFIGKLIEVCTRILEVPEQMVEFINEKYNFIHLNDHDIYYQYFMLATQKILIDRQDELSSQNNADNAFAIDSYGLYFINCYYGPFKSAILFEGVSPDKKLQSIARLDLLELEASVGPFKYITSTSAFRQLNDFITRIDKGNSKTEKGVMEGSFIQKMYFPDASQSFIYKNVQKAETSTNAEPWSELNKAVWIYWEPGFSNISNVPADVYLSVQNIKAVAEQSNFIYNQVNSSNINTYLDQETIDAIQSAVTNAKMKTHDQTLSQLYRLALLHTHGGIYMDPTTVVTEDFGWLTNIAQYPSQYIYNRYGSNPSVLMFWNPNFGGLYNWQVDEKQRTKTEWRLSFLNGFIAANKGSKFIKEWLDLFIELLLESPSNNMQTFRQCGITDFKGTSEKNHGALSKDAAKCVLGRRQAILQTEKGIATEFKGSVGYYKLWSINSLIGFFKIRSFTNLDNLDRKGLNYFLTRYSQNYVEGLLGNINFFTKIVNEQRGGLSDFLLQNSGRLLQQTHKSSIFRRYLYNKKYATFEKINGQVVVRPQ